MHEERDGHVTALELTSVVIEAWRPEVDGTMKDLRLEVSKLNIHWDRAVKENSVLALGPVTLSLELAAARSPAGYPANGPMGHNVESSHLDNVFGSVTTYTHVPVTGMTTNSH